MLGLDPVTQGADIRARLGVVPQQDTLDMELTVRENMHHLRALLRTATRRARQSVPTSCSSSSS